MTPILPDALCRLDAKVLDRVRQRNDLANVATSAVGAIVVGGALYGFAFGFWRAPSQALYSAIKLPVLLLFVSVFSTGLASMLATLLRARLSLQQTGLAILISLALTATVLGACSPIAILFTWIAESPDPSFVGLDENSPRLQPALHAAHGLLLLHVLFIALAGTMGVLRLRTLLHRLSLDGAVLRRVLVSFVAIEFFVGAQLSWVLRPFFGRPHIETSFLVANAFSGNFYEEVGLLMRSTFGDAAAFVFVFGASVGVILFARALRSDPRVFVEIVLEDFGVQLRDAAHRMIPWSRIGGARLTGAVLTLELTPDEALEREVIYVHSRDLDHAQSLARQVAAAMERVSNGPFRTAPLQA